MLNPEVLSQPSEVQFDCEAVMDFFFTQYNLIKNYASGNITSKILYAFNQTG